MLTEKQRQALELFKTGRSFCITGPAGTGKSHIINEIANICRNSDKVLGITALTGPAAYIIRGQTLHHWGGLGLAKGDANSIVTNIIMKNPTARKRWVNTRVLIIDEISMMSAELMNKVDRVAKALRHNEGFFGGLQVILCGDFAQLEPVNADQYCFESQLWSTHIQKPGNIIYFDKIIRQADPVFEKLLCEIRLGKVTEETKTILNSRKITDINQTIITIADSEASASQTETSNVSNTTEQIHKSNKNTINRSKLFIAPTILYPHKATVEHINLNELQKLKVAGHDCRVYIATDVTRFKGKGSKPSTTEESDMLDKYNNTPKTLEICLGAQVMLTVNLDTASGLVNGSRGVVSEFSGTGFPKILFDNGMELEISNFTFEVDLHSKILSRMQVPLMLAWAITIHKCQGATLTNVITDLSNVFCDGQAYVTLSRVKSLDGLFLQNINYNKITCNKKVYKFYQDLMTIEEKRERIDDFNDN